MDERIQKVDVVIPTCNPDQKLIKLIRRLNRQSYPVHHIIIMNTEEQLWQECGMESRLREQAEKDGFWKVPVELYHVAKTEFDHGKTRNQGIIYSQADIVLCMTQDAVPADEFLVEELVKGLQQTGVAASYARQLADRDCSVIEAYIRNYNYPDRDRITTKEDLKDLGIKTYFLSNVCAAYNREIYNRMGGFTHKTIFNEDMIYAAGVIQAGYGVAYCSRAKVIHSHNYSWRQQFRRNFDLAVSQADHPEVFAGISSESEGIRMVKQNISYLCKIRKPWLIPGLVVSSGMKYLGYRTGKSYKKLPRRLVMKCTMNRNYWK